MTPFSPAWTGPVACGAAGGRGRRASGLGREEFLNMLVREFAESVPDELEEDNDQEGRQAEGFEEPEHIIRNRGESFPGVVSRGGAGHDRGGTEAPPHAHRAPSLRRRAPA